MPMRTITRLFGSKATAVLTKKANNIIVYCYVGMNLFFKTITECDTIIFFYVTITLQLCRMNDVFIVQCIQCRKILGDNALMTQFHISGFSALTKAQVSVAEKEEIDKTRKECYFQKLTCVDCQSVVGRKYSKLSSEHQLLKNLFLFEKGGVSIIKYGIDDLHWRTVDFTCSDLERDIQTKQTNIKKSLVSLSKRSKDNNSRINEMTTPARVASATTVSTTDDGGNSVQKRPRVNS